MSDEKKQLYLKNTRAEATLRAYESDWNSFASYCKKVEASALPASTDTVINYIIESLETLKVSSLSRHLVSIRRKHDQHGYALNMHDIHEVFKGIKRVHGTRQIGKSALTIEDIRDICKLLPSDLNGKMQKALILTGFCGAFRRSELCNLDYEDLTFSREGVKIYIKKSKTDQSGKGRYVALPYGSHDYTCPVRNLQDWIEEAEINQGPLFFTVYHKERSERIHPITVGRIIKRLLSQVFTQRGFSPYDTEEMVKTYSGHSMRSGFVTTAAKAGVPEHLIRKQTGHSNSNMLQRYIREAEIFKENAASKIGV